MESDMDAIIVSMGILKEERGQREREGGRDREE